MYTNDRDAYRNVFFITWDKYKKKTPLEIEEQHLIDIILEHPEFCKILDNPKAHLKQEYEYEENPFLHMSLHLALREQIRMDRPIGIKDVYNQLKLIHQSGLEAEHMMLPVIMLMMNKGQQTGSMPSDDEYITELKGLLI